MCAKLVVLGSINVDHVIQVPRFVKAGETLSGSHYRIAYGGKGANQAVAAARLKAQNTQVDFIACIGHDDIGRAMKNAFAQDGMALILAQEAIQQKDFAQMEMIQRKFMLMPFMHSESAAMHEWATVLFAQYSDALTIDFEAKHKAIIDRFGRYPHRNEILGRKSSAEEITFLQQPGSAF